MSLDTGIIAHYEFPECSVVGEMLCKQVNIMDNNFVGDTIMRQFTLEVVDSSDHLGDFDSHLITISDDDGELFCFYTKIKPSLETIVTVLLGLSMCRSHC